MADDRPAQPKSILRGHKAQVHAAAFVRSNERLLTGDADGFLVAWDLTIMRPRAVWQAHENVILGVAGWDADRIITHGRDNKLIVWQFGEQDEDRLSTTLPLDPSPDPRPQPWIQYMLEVNTMNFCSFSFCPASPDSSPVAPEEALVAVPNTLASEAIDIFHLPSQERRHTVKLGEKNGMVMALSLFYLGQSLTVVAGFEDGVAAVAQLGSHGSWTIRYQTKCHSQPILSLDLSPNRDFFFTSSADSIIAKHPLPLPTPPKTVENGISRPSISQQETITDSQGSKPAETPSMKSPPLLSTAGSGGEHNRVVPTATTTTPQTTNAAVEEARVVLAEQPIKVINTKHAGQQSLHVRSDGLVFATAGWDAKVRVYSAKTLREVAVLKWHQVGCFAVAFAAVGTANDATASADSTKNGDDTASLAQSQLSARTSVTTVPKLVELSVRDKRMRQAKTAHWLAAGSKDGKVSLWDIF
ncbi:WD40-repeat-containing domain protein [Lasiosphaeris hirsuta]|uniref:ASTRA-associated protein 1 n=1 Tax=Lasiosphaeris hirsuta TaxID=260670 RepID=A0AA40AGU3_9PEZI|nr:WD40-repeat-containing domain protein [Lasiosphaeris hirsuta]